MYIFINYIIIILFHHDTNFNISLFILFTVVLLAILSLKLK